MRQYHNTNGTSTTSAREVAAHYLDNPRSANGWFRFPCPAHRGEGANAAVKDADSGGLLLYCHSRGCTSNNILTALQADGLVIKRTWPYPNGKTVHRVDQDGRRKDFSNSTGSTKGVPLRIRHDSENALVVIVEGESDADAVIAADPEGVAVGCFPGGAKMAGSADYSAVQGRRVAIWPDNDREGAKALDDAAAACQRAGAASIQVVPIVGPPDSGQGAADLDAMMTNIFLTAKLSTWEPPPQAQGMVWTTMKDALDVPPVSWIVDGLIAKDSTTLLYAQPKAGKTCLVLGLLKALSTGGAFLGSDLEVSPCWYLTEQGRSAMAAQLRLFDFADSDANIKLAYSMQNPFDTAEAFAELLLREYLNAEIKPKLIAVDTLAAFVPVHDFNDYTDIGQTVGPVIKVAQQIGKLDGCATLLVHHRNKGAGQGSEGVLGSTRLAAIVDAIVRVGASKAENRRDLHIQSRFGTGSLQSDRVSVELVDGSYTLANTTSELDERIVAALESGCEARKSITEHLNADDDGTVSDQKIINRLREMVTREQIIKEGSGRSTTYRLRHE